MPKKYAIRRFSRAGPPAIPHPWGGRGRPSNFEIRAGGGRGRPSIFEIRNGQNALFVSQPGDTHGTHHGNGPFAFRGTGLRLVPTPQARRIRGHLGQRGASEHPALHDLRRGEDSPDAEGALRGNTWIELLLWACMLWPIALVYTVWRRVGKGAKRVCPDCGGASLVPIASPAARAHRRHLSQ